MNTTILEAALSILSLGTALIILRILIYLSDAFARLLEKKALCKFLAIPMICLQRSFPTYTDAYREKGI